MPQSGDPTLDIIRIRMRMRERQQQASQEPSTASKILKKAGSLAARVALPGAVPGLAQFVGQGVANIPAAAGNAAITYGQGAANILLDQPTADQTTGMLRRARGQVERVRPQADNATDVAGTIASEFGVNAAPFIATGGLGAAGATAASAALTGTQAMAGREASTVGMVGDLAAKKFGRNFMQDWADDPAKRVAADVALDMAFNGIGIGMASRRGARATVPQGTPARSVPETNPARMLPSSTTESVYPHGEMAGPAIPMRPAAVEPDVAGAALGRAAGQVPPDPLITPAPSSGKRPRSRQKQQAMMRSTREAAARLEAEQASKAASNRAFPEESPDASASLAGIAGARKAEAAANPNRIIPTRYGRGSLEAINTLTGMGIGGATGYASGDTPQERLGLGLAGAVAGGGAMLGMSRLAMALDGLPNPNRGAMPSVNPSSNRAGKFGWWDNTSNYPAKQYVMDDAMATDVLEYEDVAHILKGDQLGTNPGGKYEGKDGVVRYLKKYSDPSQGLGEHIANRIYRHFLGRSAAPQSNMVNTGGWLAGPNGSSPQYYASRWMDGFVPVGNLGGAEFNEAAQKFAEGITLDIVTGNWDAVGMNLDNLLWNSADKVLARVDNGGAFLHRAQAGRKPLSALTSLDEMAKFFDGSNPAYRDIAAAAGIHSANDIVDRIANDIDEIYERLHKDYSLVKNSNSTHVGAKTFVDEAIDRTDMTGAMEADADAIAKMLGDRIIAVRQWAEARSPSLAQKKQKAQFDAARVSRQVNSSLHASTLRLPWGQNDQSPRLLANHGLLAQRLSALLNQGGIPAPSMSIIPEWGEPAKYGDVDVLMKSHVVDPANTDIWHDDAFTPRTPTGGDLVDFGDVGKASEWTPEKAVERMRRNHPGDWQNREGMYQAPHQSIADKGGRMVLGPDDLQNMTSDQFSKLGSVGGLRMYLNRKFKSLSELRKWSAENLPSVSNSKDFDDMRNRASNASNDLYSRMGKATDEVLTQLDILEPKHGFREQHLLTAAAWAEGEFQQGIISKAQRASRLLHYMQKILSNDATSNYGGTINKADSLASRLLSIGSHERNRLRLLAQGVIDEVDRILVAPSTMAEGKPKRVIKWDEVAGVILPPPVRRHNGMDWSTLENALRTRNVPFIHNNASASMDELGNKHKLDWRVVDRAKRLNLIRQRRGFASQLAANGRNPFGFGTAEAMGGVAGGGAGGLAGGQVGDTDEERTRNAMLGALAGIGAGAGGMNLLGKAFKSGGKKPPASTPRPVASSPAGPRTGSAYEQALASGLGKPKVNEPVLNPSARNVGPASMASREEKILRQNRQFRTGIPDAVVLRFADAVDADELVMSNVVKMDSSQLMAVGNKMAELRTQADDLMEQYAKASAEDAPRLSEELDTTLGKLLQYDLAFNKAGSEQGRGLRILGKIAASRGTLESAIAAARKALGVEGLSDDLVRQLRETMTNPSLKTAKAREVALTKVIRQAMQLPWWRVVLDGRRVGMLTAPATWMVNLTGNVAESANRNLIVTPVAAAMDKAFSYLTGKQRTVTTSGRGAGFVRGAKKGAASDAEMFRQVARGEHVKPMVADEGFESLRLNSVDYQRDFAERIGKEGTALRKGAEYVGRTAQRGTDLVYSMMDAADRPFYEAALAQSYGERANLKAMNEGLKRGTPEYAERVAHLLQADEAGDLVNMEQVDHIIAQWEALDDTFKTNSSLSNMIRGAKNPVVRGVAEWAVPFIKTPTNLIRKAFEATPGVGTLASEAHLLGLKEKFAKAGIPAEQVATELRRMRTLNASKQMTTGLGLVLAGFALTEAGMLTGDYVPIMGRDDADNVEADRRRLSGQPPLSIKIDGTAHSLSAFAQFAPLLAFGHAIAMEHKVQKEKGQSMVTPDAMARVAGRTALAAGRTIAEFPMLQGVKNITDSFSGDRAGDFGSYLGREAASFIPASSLMAAGARTIDPLGARKAEGFTQSLKERIPFMREDLPAKVGPMGEVTPNMDPFSQLFSPTRPRRVQNDQLHQSLDQIGFYPSNGEQGADESYADYSARRQQEGPNEQGLLQSVLGGGDGWSYVGKAAVDSLNATGDWRFPLRSALSRQRQAVKAERLSRRPVTP